MSPLSQLATAASLCLLWLCCACSKEPSRGPVPSADEAQEDLFWRGVLGDGEVPLSLQAVCYQAARLGPAAFLACLRERQDDERLSRDARIRLVGAIRYAYREDERSFPSMYLDGRYEYDVDRWTLFPIALQEGHVFWVEGVDSYGVQAGSRGLRSLAEFLDWAEGSRITEFSWLEPVGDVLAAALLLSESSQEDERMGVRLGVAMTLNHSPILPHRTVMLHASYDEGAWLEMLTDLRESYGPIEFDPVVGEYVAEESSATR